MSARERFEALTIWPISSEADQRLARYYYLAGHAAGAEDMRERAAELVSELHVLVPPSAAIRALPLEPEEENRG